MNLCAPRCECPDGPGGADGTIVRVDTPGTVVAAAVPGNPLAGGWSLPDTADVACLLAWSGTLASSLFEPHPATWLRPGHEALAALRDSVSASLAAAGRRLCFHPHARHVLNDARSCSTFVRDRGDAPVGVALAPVSLLEPSMLDDLEDHLVRTFETLGPIADLVILWDVAPGADDGTLRPVPLGDGVMPRDTVTRLLAEHLPAETAIVLLPRDLDRQRAWLAG